MKIKTSELIGPVLDWAVSVAEMDTEDGLLPPAYSTDWSQGGPIIEREGDQCRLRVRPAVERLSRLERLQTPARCFGI